MNYICRTNLDEGKLKKWPSDFLTCPRVGDYVAASSGYHLKVVSITHKMQNRQFVGEVIAVPCIEVELNR